MVFKVFFSYAHKDELHLDRLKEHLAPLKNQGLIDGGWHDREIDAGAEWEPEIIRHLETADIILLLVSAAFMNSDYCYGKELRRAIERHERKEARVIPIILSPVDWQIPPLDKLQALPTDAKPVTGPGWHSVDDALLNVVKGIRVAIRNLQKCQRSSYQYQYQLNYIVGQMAQGQPPLAALRQCDSDLATFVEWMICNSPPLLQPQIDNSDAADLEARLNKFLEEIAPVGDGELRLQAELTPDLPGVIADSFNYMIEELAKTVNNIRKTTSPVLNELNVIVRMIREQKQILGKSTLTVDSLATLLPNGTIAPQIPQLRALLEDLYSRCEVIEREVNDIGKRSHQLRESVSQFHLPESMAQS